MISFIDEDEVIEKILRHCKVMERVCPTPAADRNHRAAGSGGPDSRLRILRAELRMINPAFFIW